MPPAFSIPNSTGRRFSSFFAKTLPLAISAVYFLVFTQLLYFSSLVNTTAVYTHVAVSYCRSRYLDRARTMKPLLRREGATKPNL